MQVALKAATHKRRRQLAIFYDDAARKLRAERSRSGDEDFDIAKVICRIDMEALTVAEQLCDREEAAGKAAPHGRRTSFSSRDSPTRRPARRPPAATPRGTRAVRAKARAKGKWLDSQKPTQQYWSGGTGGSGPCGSSGWGRRDAEEDTRAPVSPKRRKTSH